MYAQLLLIPAHIKDQSKRTTFIAENKQFVRNYLRWNYSATQMTDRSNVTRFNVIDCRQCSHHLVIHRTTQIPTSKSQPCQNVSANHHYLRVYFELCFYLLRSFICFLPLNLIWLLRIFFSVFIYEVCFIYYHYQQIVHYLIQLKIVYSNA